VIGAQTQPLWVEIAEMLRSSLPHVQERTIDGVGHLLQIQRPEPVARAIAGFLAQNVMAGDRVHA
jgi:pimeloyl-ACP methyl ester carboxylesterase